jgi:hypothetical protein
LTDERERKKKKILLVKQTRQYFNGAKTKASHPSANVHETNKFELYNKSARAGFFHFKDLDKTHFNKVNVTSNKQPMIAFNKFVKMFNFSFTTCTAERPSRGLVAFPSLTAIRRLCVTEKAEQK